MPSWFDLATLDKIQDSQNDDERGILQSISAVDALVQAEVDIGIPENKIFIGGFSQGGAVALYGSLTGKRKLGGIIALSESGSLYPWVWRLSRIWQVPGYH